MNVNAKNLGAFIYVWFATTATGYTTDITSLKSATSLSLTTQKLASIESSNDYSKIQGTLDNLFLGSESKTKRDSVPVDFSQASTISSKQNEIKFSKKEKSLKLSRPVPMLKNCEDKITSDKAQHFWHGPNPNPSNDPDIQHNMDENVDNWCSNHPNAPACNPNNPYSPLHNPNGNPTPNTPSGTHGSGGNGGGDIPCDTIGHDGSINC